MRGSNERHIVTSIRKIGLPLRVRTENGWREGRGVLYPLRWEQTQWGSLSVQTEGIAQSLRYLLYCPHELLEGCGYGSEIVQDGERFVMIWKDDFVSRWGGYVKACLRKVTGEDEDEQ